MSVITYVYLPFRELNLCFYHAFIDWGLGSVNSSAVPPLDQNSSIGSEINIQFSKSISFLAKGFSLYYMGLFNVPEI